MTRDRMREEGGVPGHDNAAAKLEPSMQSSQQDPAPTKIMT